MENPHLKQFLHRILSFSLARVNNSLSRMPFIAVPHSVIYSPLRLNLIIRLLQYLNQAKQIGEREVSKDVTHQQQRNLHFSSQQYLLVDRVELDLNRVETFLQQLTLDV